MQSTCYATSRLKMYAGRLREIQQLEKKHKINAGQLIAIYGRRRIGKSALIKKFIANKTALSFEGLEHQQTKAQIKYFISILAKQTKNPIIIRTKFENWDQVFQTLTDELKKLGNHKIILVFDEVQWLAAGKSKLISIIKSYWDRFWKDMGVKLILCGSVASYMINGVIKSKALYGRINLQINLMALTPGESKLLLNKKSNEEALKYL
ncbi:MAG: ATP-binding protein, partial [Bdellovibrionales bacterium]